MDSTSVVAAVTEQFDVVVVGGSCRMRGGRSCGRMGLKTAAFTLNVDSSHKCHATQRKVASAKGHLVRRLTLSAASWAKSPMLWESSSGCLTLACRGRLVSARQCDKQAYPSKNARSARMQSNLKIKQAEVADLLCEESSIGGYRSRKPVSVCHSRSHSDEESAFSCFTPTTRQRRLFGIRLRDGRTVGAQAVIITRNFLKV